METGMASTVGAPDWSTIPAPVDDGAGMENPHGWDMIPGARGCTPQTCSFRDHFAELKGLGVDHLFGLSTQDPDYQREAAERLHLPFAILSDEHFELTRAMNLPTFETSGMTPMKRFTLVIDNGTPRFLPRVSTGPERQRRDRLVTVARFPRRDAPGAIRATERRQPRKPL